MKRLALLLALLAALWWAARAVAAWLWGYPPRKVNYRRYN